MKINYVTKRFSHGVMVIIEAANMIIEEYQAKGYDLTLRQLYYQFVARGFMVNEDKNYKRLGSFINDGRMAGLIDWDAIVDRTRYLRSLGHWAHPAHIVEAAAKQFRIDKWETQHDRPEVWIEKDALVGVISGVCEKYDVPYFSCRGYVSQSEMFSAAQRILGYIEHNQSPIIFYLGDHDPSGIDMTRDIKERLQLFTNDVVEVKRLALHMEQVQQYNPPPNPAKIEDSRYRGYVKKYGKESWELDALDPEILSGLVEENVLKIRHQYLYDEAVKEEEWGRKRILDVIGKI